MPNPTEQDLEKFEASLARYRENDKGCMIAPEYFNGSRSFRAYQLYWRVKYGYWPGTLKKTCSTDKCLVHYEEKGHVLTPQDVQEIKDAPDSWGINTQLAKKYGVSNARITQIRGKRR